MKANHNMSVEQFQVVDDVSNKTKILKWKQITTVIKIDAITESMFPIRQRY